MPETKVTSLNVLSCQTNSQNHKDIQFTVILEKSVIFLLQSFIAQMR